MQAKTFMRAMLVACMFLIVSTFGALAGDPQNARSVETSTPSSVTESKASSSPSCKTEIGEYEEKELVKLYPRHGYEQAMLGEWSGHWWTPENNAGGEFNIHMDHVTKQGADYIVHSYYLMRHGNSNGCGGDWFPRSPGPDSPQRYNETRLHSGATFDHTHWNHPFELYRVEREDGHVEYYMIADTEFGQLHDDGPWRTIVTLKAADEKMVEALEEVRRMVFPNIEVSEK